MKKLIVLVFVFLLTVVRYGAALECYYCLETSLSSSNNAMAAILSPKGDPLLCNSEDPLPKVTCNENIGETKCVYISLTYEDQWEHIRQCGLEMVDYCQLEFPGGAQMDKCIECKQDLCNENPNR